jgi:outer membrane receptor protein involved in Fe transport
MPDGAKTGGLIIPDVFTFSNAGIVPVPTTNEWKKQVNSVYGKLSLGYKDMIYLDATYRKDWSSALPSNKNGYGYPSIGTSFIFSELIQGFQALSFGKVRASWAQVGGDVDANKINPTYTTGSQPFNGKILMYVPTQLVDPNIQPSLNTSIEAGFDTRFLQNRLGLSFTYYRENKKDEIIPVSIPRGSGYDTYLTNAGEALRRGIEVSIDADVLKNTSGLTWNIAFNLGTYNTTVEELPGDLQAITGVGGTGTFNFISVINQLGAKWGQLRGTRIARDADGNKIIQASGLYATEANHYYGSIIPDYSGGIVNRLNYKGISLAVSVDFQKGGKFFSLTEQWGTSSGLLEATAANNDRGGNVRDDVATENGGVHVTGVDAGGAPVDMYVDAHTYFSQWYSNTLAEPFVHDKSYIKLRDVSLSYDLTKVLNIKFIKGASIGVVGRNLWLMAVAKDNTHRWDPSVLSQNYGENGQLPGTRSYGVNVKLTF